MLKKINNNYMREIGSRPFLYLALGISVMSILMIFWAIVYKIQPDAKGYGMVIRKGKIERVTSPSGGLIEEILVEPGTNVDAGELLIKLDTEEYEIRYRSSKSIAQISSRTSPAELEQKRLSTRQEINAIQASLIVLEKQIADNETLIKNIEPLVADGDISKNEYLSQLRELDSMKLQALTYKGKIAKLRAEEQSEINRISSELRRNLEDKEDSEYEKTLATNISSPINGIVSSIDVAPGTVVEKGGSVAQISYETGGIRGIFLASADNARKMLVGDECLISPAESPPEKYGYVRGVVHKVGLVPTNPSALGRQLGLDYTVNSLFEFAQSQTERNIYEAFPYLVEVTIPTTNGKPEWTTGTVPTWGLTPGGPAQVQCTYETFRPISFLVPWIRQQAGYRQDINND